MFEVRIQKKKFFNEGGFLNIVEFLLEEVLAIIFEKVSRFVDKNWRKLLPYVIKRIDVSEDGIVDIQLVHGGAMRFHIAELESEIARVSEYMKSKVERIIIEKISSGHPVAVERDESFFQKFASEILEELSFPLEFVALQIVSILRERNELEEKLETSIEDTDDKTLRTLIVARVFGRHPRNIERELKAWRLASNKSRTVGFIPPEETTLLYLNLETLFRGGDRIVIKKNPRLKDVGDEYVVRIRGEVYRFGKELIEPIKKELGEPKNTYIIAGKDGNGILVLEYKVGKFAIMPRLPKQA